MKKWFVCFAIVLGLSGCKPIEDMKRSMDTMIQVIQFFFPFTRPNRYPPHTWQEEVQLADGSIILVERDLTNYASTKNYRETIRVLNAKGMDIPPVWFSNEETMILDRNQDGIWYTVVAPSSVFCFKLYQAINNKWQLVEFDTKLNGRRSNLHENIYEYHDSPTTFNSNAYKDLPKILKIDDNERHYLNFHEMKGHDIRYKRSTGHREVEAKIERFVCN